MVPIIGQIASNQYIYNAYRFCAKMVIYFFKDY